MKRRIRILAFAFAWILAGGAAMAQLTTGQISGDVRDEGGQPLSGVTVLATSPSLQGERTVTTDAGGKFNLPVLPSGKYDLKFRLAGHQTIQLSTIVRLGTITPVAATLKKGELVETLTVAASAPMIETKTADATVNMSFAKLDTIPTSSRSFRDLTKYVPSITSVDINTTTGAAGGFPSIRGEGQYGDNYLIDGLTVRDPAVYTTGTPLPFQSMEEVQIITDGFSPEYGQSMGGIVNVVTKSGSNTFGGEVAYLYTGDRLSAKYQDTFLATPTKFNSKTPYANVGGAILKDKLWFFTTYDRLDDLSAYAPVAIEGFGTLPEGVTTNESNLLFGKLSYAINAKHNVSANYTWRNLDTAGLGADAATPEARQTQTVKDTRVRLNYQAIFTPNSILQFKFGNVTRNIDTLPMGGLGPAQWEITSYGITMNNAWRQQTSERTRNDYAAIYTQFLNPGGWLGSHEIKAGFEYHDPKQISGTAFTGADDDVIQIGMNEAGSDFGLEDTFSNGTKFQLVAALSDPTDLNSATVLIPSVLTEYSSAGSSQNSNTEYGFFIQDRIEIKKWNILIGFREDKQTSYNDAQVDISHFSFNKSFSPRISITYDITGDGKNMFKTGWGRLFDVNSTRFGEFANQRTMFSYRNYNWIGGQELNEDFRDHVGDGGDFDIQNAANWEFGSEQSQESNGLDYGGVTRPAHVDRFLVEYDREIKDNYVFKARYVNGKSRGLIDDIHYLYNTWIVQNTDLKRRDYNSVEFEFNGNPSPNFQFNASYVHSEAKGTNPGQFEASGFLGSSGSGNDIGVYLDRPASDPAYWVNYYADYYEDPAYDSGVPTTWVDVPSRDYNNDDTVNQYDRDLYIQNAYAGLGGVDGDDGWYGYLPYSIDDQVKVYGRFNLPRFHNVYVTAFGMFATGYHTQRRGLQGLYGDYLTFSQVYSPTWTYVDPDTGASLTSAECTAAGFDGCEAVRVTDTVPGQPGFNAQSGERRGLNTNPSFWSIDLSIGKTWSVGKKMLLEGRLELFNITNNQVPLSVNDRAVDTYMDPLTRQQPRSARLFARLAF